MRKTAFLFPGQGSQSVGMGAEFYQEYDFVRCMCIASAYLGDFQFSQLLDEVCSSTYRRQKSAKAQFPKKRLTFGMYFSVKMFRQVSQRNHSGKSAFHMDSRMSFSGHLSNPYRSLTLESLLPCLLLTCGDPTTSLPEIPEFLIPTRFSHEIVSPSYKQRVSQNSGIAYVSFLQRL